MQEVKLPHPVAVCVERAIIPGTMWMPACVKMKEGEGPSLYYAPAPITHGMVCGAECAEKK